MSTLRLPIGALAFLLLAASADSAAVGGYVESTLQTSATDPDLVNPWGVSFSPTGPFWVSDNGTGKSTLYNSAGAKLGLVVSMPAGSSNVTGQVFNGTSAFKGDAFIFATEQGTITGWGGGTSASVLFSVAGAEYKGLAISADKGTLYATNFATGKIDVFSSTGLIGSFSDPSVKSGYAPFNIQNIDGKLYVTYALRGSTGDDVAGAGHGFVSVFDPTTHTFTRLVSQGALNSPWGLALAPANFGALSNDLLVGNFGDGTINAYNPLSGSLIGTLAGVDGTPLVNDGLWDLTFGNGGSGGLADSLYLTAGPNDESGGVFARIDAVATPEPAGILLCLVGLAALCFFRRQFRHSIN
jgi:uncharacterized protein (TIGR03118 family)